MRHLVEERKVRRTLAAQNHPLMADTKPSTESLTQVELLFRYNTGLTTQSYIQ